MKIKNLLIPITFFIGMLCSTLSNISCQSTTIKAEQVREGDIIFQTSQSSQSKYIQKATQSTYTHCGVIVKVGNEYKVLETLRTIRLTPLKKFIERGRNQKYWIKRSDLKDIKINYDQYLGRTYDLAFKANNSKYYCSELVYEIYKRQLGINLCDLHPIKSYAIKGLERTIEKRGMNLNELVVAPSDLYKSPYLHDLR